MRRGIALGARFEPRATTPLESKREAALTALIAWNALRLKINTMRSERGSLQCDETGRLLTIRGQYSADEDPGVCKECGPCVRRHELNTDIWYAKRTLRRLRQSMQAAATQLTGNRRSKPRPQIPTRAMLRAEEFKHTYRNEPF